MSQAHSNTQLPLYVITHSELTSGYQIAQISHVVADFSIYRPNEFKNWHNNSQYIVALQTQDEKSLVELYEKAQLENLDVICFREPDLNHSVTSLAFVPHIANRRLLSHLPLAGKSHGTINKRTGNKK